MLAQQKQEIVALFQAALAPIVAGTDLTPNIVLERPRDPTHGDIACNIAMQLAKPLKTNPRELATRLVAALQADPKAQGLVASAEIAGPGFINLRLADAAKQSVARTILQQGAAYGRGDGGAGHHVIIEFVSANPTGPLHVGHGRQAALGDSLSALFESQGHKVTREFYYNDAGVQIATLATSVQARARGFKPGDAEWPESAYNGDYIQDIADDFLARKTVSASDGQPATASGDVDDIESIRRFAVTYLRNEQDQDLQAFGVKFDNYYLESSLYADGKVASRRAGAGRRRRHLRAGRRAVAEDHRLRRRQGPRDAQVRRHLHLFRAGRRVPHPEVQARLRPGHQRPGQRPPRHHRARARRPAGGRTSASRRATPTTCCTRWSPS
jgi:arginyl-tRNA synthetase